MNKTQIPKIIHYCWFGKNDLSESAKKCIASWKNKCSDYIIIEWNEDNFDINTNMYIKAAYEKKKWAFVSDYVRLYALVNYGGIYLDTDVEIVKKFDIQLLSNTAFLGFEDEKSISTGIMGCEKNCLFFKKILDSYSSRKFILENGQEDMTTNVDLITNFCIKEGFEINNSTQKKNGILLLSKDFFSPKDNITGNISITENTYTIHYFSGSWLPKIEQNFIKLQNKLSQFLGKNLAIKIVGFISAPYRVRRKIKKIGFKSTVEFAMQKILKGKRNVKKK